MNPSRLAKVVMLGIVAGLLTGGAACSSDDGGSEDDVRIDTRSALARQQYDANVAFARAYTPRCGAVPEGVQKRVIVTGYGRFQSNLDNATGRIVSALTGAPYPMTTPPAAAQIDPPEAQVSVQQTTLVDPELGRVAVCGMILPVYWDLAPILLAREMDAWNPDLVVMNGVATGRVHIPMRIELGSANRASTRVMDGTGILRAADDASSDMANMAPVIANGPAVLPSLFGFNDVRVAMESVIERDPNLGTTITGVDFGGYPSTWLTYLCNNIVYVLNYLMDRPGTAVNLLEPSQRLNRRDTGVRTSLRRDFRKTPRVFMHWPDVPRAQHTAAAATLRAGIFAALRAHDAGRSVRGATVTPDQPADL
jgi:pyrrolidone-carboxylate peptidase